MDNAEIEPVAQGQQKVMMDNDGGVYVYNRAARRRKLITKPQYTSKTKRMRSKEEVDARRNRVLRIEKGEQERIAKKKVEQDAK